MNVEAGQIWQENDKRFERFIRVVHVFTETEEAVIVTCNKNGKPFPEKRLTNAKLRRFGKAGGYRFVKPAGHDVVKTPWFVKAHR